MVHLAASDLSPEILHERYANKIERLIRRLLGPDSDQEDLCQDVLMIVFRKAQTLRDPASLDFWVTQVTINTVKCAIRQRRLRRHASLDVLPEGSWPKSQPNFEARELASRAVRVFERLPDGDRMLLMSYWFTAATARDIASRAGCSRITVLRRLFKARTRYERLARKDPELARCLDEAAISSRRRRRRSWLPPGHATFPGITG